MKSSRAVEPRRVKGMRKPELAEITKPELTEQELKAVIGGVPRAPVKPGTSTPDN